MHSVTCRSNGGHERIPQPFLGFLQVHDTWTSMVHACWKDWHGYCMSETFHLSISAVRQKRSRILLGHLAGGLLGRLWLIHKVV